MEKTRGRMAQPTTSAKDLSRTSRAVMVRNVCAADGFFRPDAAKPARRQGPDRGAMAVAGLMLAAA